MCCTVMCCTVMCCTVMCCTVMCCRYPLLAEAGQQAGQQQGTGDAGQSARYHRHSVAEGGRDRARLQVTDPRAAGDHGGLQPAAGMA